MLVNWCYCFPSKVCMNTIELKWRFLIVLFSSPPFFQPTFHFQRTHLYSWSSSAYFSLYSIRLALIFFLYYNTYLALVIESTSRLLVWNFNSIIILLLYPLPSFRLKKDVSLYLYFLFLFSFFFDTSIIFLIITTQNTLNLCELNTMIILTFLYVWGNAKRKDIFWMDHGRLST